MFTPESDPVLYKVILMKMLAFQNEYDKHRIDWYLKTFYIVW